MNLSVTRTDQQRALVLTRVIAGALSVSEAAGPLGLSKRSVWRLTATLKAGTDGSIRYFAKVSVWTGFLAKWAGDSTYVASAAKGSSFSQMVRVRSAPTTGGEK